MKLIKLFVRIIFLVIVLLVFYGLSGGFDKPGEGLLGLAVAVAAIFGSYRLLIWAFLE